MARRSAKAERERLRADLLAAGRPLPDVARVLAERLRVRPRTAWRYAMGWPQWKLVQELRAAHSGLAVGESRVSEWESWPHGGARPTLEVLADLATVFGHGCTVADLVDEADLAAMSAGERQLVEAARRPTAVPVPGPGASPSAKPPGETAARAASAVVVHAATMESFRTADRQVGGGGLYLAVAAYLGSAVARDLLNVGADTGPVFTAAAALSEMAGWMAHDAGDDDLAGRHFARAVRLAEIEADPQVMAHLLSSSAHLALGRSDPRLASALAARGLDAVGPAGPAQLRARLLTMQARAAASMADSRGAQAALAAARHALARRRDEPTSPWVSQFDDASLAMEAARAHWTLGDLAAAREHAEEVVARRSTGRARARALGRLVVADVHLAQGRVEEAAALAVETLRVTTHLQSHVVTGQLHAFGKRLAAHGAGGAVRDAVDLLRTRTADRPAALTGGGPSGAMGL